MVQIQMITDTNCKKPTYSLSSSLSLFLHTGEQHVQELVGVMLVLRDYPAQGSEAPQYPQGAHGAPARHRVAAIYNWKPMRIC